MVLVRVLARRGTLKSRNVRLLAGECLLVKCPDAARRSCRRKRKEKGGTCRSWPECRCIRAAGGIRICLVRQILPSFFLPFSPTASNARFTDISPADIPPPGAGRSLTSAVASGRKIRRHSLVGFIMGAADLYWLFCAIFMLEVCVLEYTKPHKFSFATSP